MKKIFTIFMLILLTGCADNVTLQSAIEIESVGFLFGLWHGICVPFSFLGSLFDNSIAIYAIYNNGGWYDFGYFLGIGGFSTCILIRK